MSELLEHVEHVIRARALCRPGQRLLVAVSGGVDSLVLLHVLHELAAKHRWGLTVAHLNHQLRGLSSDADERLVRCAAARLRLPVVAERARICRLDCAHRLSLEMAARKVRHDFLAGVAARLRIRTVALAQHADDQVELFFLRLLRGSGGEGLAGMKWRSPSPSKPRIELVRPLLDQPKSVLRQFAAKHGIRYREDASNALLDIQRNRIRHELLPLLRKSYQPALDKVILRVMAIAGEEAEFAVQAARNWLQGRGGGESEVPGPKAKGLRACSQSLMPWPETALPRTGFEQLPVAVQRRCVQLQLARQGVAPDFQLVEELRVKAEKHVAVGLPRVAGVNSDRSEQRADALPDGGDRVRYAVRDRSGSVRVRVGGGETSGAEFMLVDLLGGAEELDFGGIRVQWRVGSGGDYRRDKGSVGCECFDADRVGSPVILRHWRPGDRFQPIGMTRSVKLQDFFTNHKVPRDQRRRLVVGTSSEGEVFWVEGMRIGERYKLTEGTIRRLHWRWKRVLTGTVAACRRVC